MLELPIVERLLGLSQQCKRKKDLRHAFFLYACICEHGLESDTLLGNSLVPTFVDCGSLSDARHVFQGLAGRAQNSWTSLIVGSLQCGDFQHACRLFHHMQHESVRPSSLACVALLKACAQRKDIQRGRNIRSEITRNGLEGDPFVSSSLVDMYAKCNSLSEAHELFDQLPAVRNTVTWTALISAYAEQGYGEEALHCFEEMSQHGVPPDAVTFVSSLKACGITRAIGKGQVLCCEIAKKGLEYDLHVGSTIVDMYMKCGSHVEAQDMFNLLSIKNVVAWTALIAGYVEQGVGDEALICYGQMQVDGVSPNSCTFICMLKACGCAESIEIARQLFSEIIRLGFEGDECVGNTLVNTFVRCDSICEARDVFDKLLVRNVVSWTALLAGYTKRGCGKEALSCFEKMCMEGVSPNNVSFICTLKACGSTGDGTCGKGLHTEIVKKSLERDPSISNTIVSMYGKCGLLEEAQEVFNKLSVRHAVSWNALIAGYSELGLVPEVLNCFEEMQVEGVCPDALTFVCSLKACSSLEVSKEGQLFCVEVIKRGFERDLSICSELLNMYIKFGMFDESRQMLGKFPFQDVALWNVLVVGYADHGLGVEALSCYMEMQLKGFLPDVITFICCLKACSSIRSLDLGQVIHAQIIRKGVEVEISIGNALVDVYGKCNQLAEAQKIFNCLSDRDAVSWAAIISGYAEHGCYEEVLTCYEKMQVEAISEDVASLVHCLKACSVSGALQVGQSIHDKFGKMGLEKDLFVGNTLIDMYGSCGLIEEAKEVFNRLHSRDIVSWNAIIKGYGENHKGSIAVQCFKDMLLQGVVPDAVTFSCILAACSHASMVSKGLEYFKMMVEECRIAPLRDHYVCMVDLLARSGHVYEAARYADSMQCSEVLAALLSACKNYGKVELGRACFLRLIKAVPEDAAAYLLMSDLYVSADSWSDASRVDELRKQVRAKKKAASAFIEVNRKLHEFVVGSNQGQSMVALHDILSSRLKYVGYTPNLDLVWRPKTYEKVETW